MATQPRSKALFGGDHWPHLGAFVFDSADDCLAFMFGAPQHDKHVRQWRSHKINMAQLATYPARERAVLALLEEMRERDRARDEAEAPARRAEFAQWLKDCKERNARRRREIEALNQAEEQA